MRTTLFTGFLGSGKTTTLTRVLREQAATESLGVIVSDLSALEVDGELVRNAERVSEAAGTLVSLTGGSQIGEHGVAFQQALKAMQAKGLRHVLIEASGSSDPLEIIQQITSCEQTELGAVIAMVDCRAMQHDYEEGRALVQADDWEEWPTAMHLLVRQIRLATVIALTKGDLVDDAARERIRGALAALNPAAKITACQHGKLDFEGLLHAAPYDLACVDRIIGGASPWSAEDCDIGDTVIRDARPFHPQRFHSLFQNQLGLGVFRSKGFLWFVSRPDDVLLWNQAGGTLGLEYLGTWRASVLKDPSLLPEERHELSRQLEGTHPDFGDRCCELTVIGTPRDREIFCREMMKCFCTEAEVADWLHGKTFPDPWPKTRRVMN